jgi:hypothetical protein
MPINGVDPVLQINCLVSMTVVRFCGSSSLSLLFLLLTCCLYGCSAGRRLSLHERGGPGVQIQQEVLPSQHVPHLHVLATSNEVKVARQPSHAQHGVEAALSAGPVDALLRKLPRALTAEVSALPSKVTPTGSIAFFHTQHQEACESASLHSCASKVPLASIPVSESSSYGPFVLDGGREVLFKPVSGQWQARVKHVFLAREETLPVVYQKDVATMLSALQGARKVDVASRIHIITPDQLSRCVYLGTLGGRGGAKKITEKRKEEGEQSATSNTRHETENSRDGALDALGSNSRARATPSMSEALGDTAYLPYEMPMVLSGRTYHYVPLLNKIDMIQSYLMDTIDSFEKYLTGLRENNVEDVAGWKKFIQISVANTCKVVDKLYTYIGKLVVGKITAEACLHNAIMCREDYLMSHASHIDSWLYEECYELHNIIERVGNHFSNIALCEPPLQTTPTGRRVLNPLFSENAKEGTEIEGNINALKGAIRQDIMSREECRGAHGVPDPLKDCFNNTNAHGAPAYVPIPTDKRLFKFFFPEDSRVKEGVIELKEAIREDMIFRLDTINSIIVMLFNICRLEQSVSEETINLLHRTSTRCLWPKFLGRKSGKIDHPDGSTPLNALTSLLEKVNCNYMTQPGSVFQKIILTARLDEMQCVFAYFKIKYENDGAALIKSIHFAQTQQWFNNRAVKMYNTSYVEAGDMIGRMFLPHMGLGIEKEHLAPEKMPGVFALVSMFDRCRLAAEEQQTTMLLRPDFLIPEEAGDWQTPTRNIFSVNHAHQVFTREDDSTGNETAIQEIHSNWSAMQNLNNAQSAASHIQKAWREYLLREDLEKMNTAAELASEYLANTSSGADDIKEREPRILGNKQEKILNDLFSDNSQLVKYRDYKNVWERLGGSIRSTAGGSHQELCNVNGDVLGGIFKHNNNQTYGKRCVEKLLRRPMRRLMVTKNLHIRDGRVLHKSDRAAEEFSQTG